MTEYRCSENDCAGIFAMESHKKHKKCAENADNDRSYAKKVRFTKT